MRKFAILLILLMSTILPVRAQDNSIPEGMLIVAPELYDRAVTAFQAQDYEQAVLDSSMVILLNPTYYRAYFLRGVSYLSLEQPDSALADLQTAIDHAPDAQFETLVRLTRADIFVQQESWDSALQELDAAIEASPDAVDGYLMRAGVYASQERYEDAIADFEQVITLAPDNLQAYVGRALANRELGNYQAALDDYTLLIESNPQSADLYLARGAVYSASGSVAEAGADYLQWVLANRTSVNEDHQLTIGESVQLDLQQGLLYYVPFRAAEGQIINVEATGEPNTQVDPVIVLVKAEDGTPLAGDDDSGGEFNAAILGYTIPADGVYGILLSHSGGGAEGAVVLKLASVGG